ncbi:hypothetical protein V1264_008292 [Littorina saxatilis]|uniref:B box-type domain-containing protein n=1 Tax=Littorina saxatilis TaxID=31220 RepID=A0AAN9ASP8_9CAEN
MERTTCRYHLGQNLGYLCCQSLICDKCREEEHFDHDFQAVSEVAKERTDELKSLKTKLEYSMKDGADILKRAQNEVVDFEDSVDCAREIMSSKVEAIRKWAEEYQKRADETFERLKKEGKRELTKSVRNIRQELNSLQNQKEDIEKCLQPSQSEQYVVNFSTKYFKEKPEYYPGLFDFRKRLQTYKLRVVLNGNTLESCQHAIEEYMGVPVNVQMSPETDKIPSMCLLPQFRVDPEVNCRVTAILPLQDVVCVTYQNQNDVTNKSSRVAMFTPTGRKLKPEEQVFESAQLEMVHIPSEKLLVYSPKTQHRKMVALGDKLDSGASVPREYIWSQTEDEFYVVREVNPLAATHDKPRPVCSKILSKPVLLGVSRDGKFFAVVTESCEISVYEAGDKGAIVTVEPNRRQKGRPTSICFHQLKDRLVLLVADAAWNHICVIDFRVAKQRVIGPLTLGCDMMTSPSAVTSDGEGRVWIGCEDGQVIVCVPTDNMLLEHPKLVLEEDSDGYLTPLEIAEMYREIGKRDAQGLGVAAALPTISKDEELKGENSAFQRGEAFADLSPLPTTKPRASKKNRLSGIFGKHK